MFDKNIKKIKLEPHTLSEIFHWAIDRSLTNTTYDSLIFPEQ